MKIKYKLIGDYPLSNLPEKVEVGDYICLCQDPREFITYLGNRSLTYMKRYKIVAFDNSIVIDILKSSIGIMTDNGVPYRPDVDGIRWKKVLK